MLNILPNWLDVGELAAKWAKFKIGSRQIEHLFADNKLRASINIKNAALVECEVERTFNGIDVAPIAEIYGNGLYDIVDYSNLLWRVGSNGVEVADLGGKHIFLSDSVTFKLFYVDMKSYMIEKQDLIVRQDEIIRFEKENDLEKKDGEEDTFDETTKINPRYENSLLMIIASLLEVISGDSEAYKIPKKHPLVPNQADLIEKLSNLGRPGLSQRNLEKVFARAKRERG